MISRSHCLCQFQSPLHQTCQKSQFTSQFSQRRPRPPPSPANEVTSPPKSELYDQRQKIKLPLIFSKKNSPPSYSLLYTRSLTRAGASITLDNIVITFLITTIESSDSCHIYPYSLKGEVLTKSSLVISPFSLT